MYRVVKFFTDLQDGDHPYHVGDIFPRDGVEVTGERITELSGNNNRQGVPLIEYIEEPKQETAEKEDAAVESAGQEEAPVKKRAPRKKRTKTSAKK